MEGKIILKVIFILAVLVVRSSSVNGVVYSLISLIHYGTYFEVSITVDGVFVRATFVPDDND